MTVYVDDDGQLRAKVDQLRAARRAGADWKAIADELRTDILQVLEGQTGAVTASGLPLAHIAVSTRMKVNTKKLQAKYPEVYDDVIEEAETKTLSLED